MVSDAAAALTDSAVTGTSQSVIEETLASILMSSTMLDSPAVMAARLRAVGIPETSVLKFIGKINTMAKLAWASSAQPVVGEEKPFLDMLVKNLELPSIDSMDDGELAGWRRVWFEAHTIAVSDLRLKVERTEDSAPRRIPVPERAARLDSQKSRLNGVSIVGPLVPSHALVDFVVSMREDETLKYVDPAKCTSREDELVGVKREQFVKPNSSGVLVVKESDSAAEADMTSEFRVRQALQRRSLALDQAELLPYSISEGYHDFLFSLISMPPPPRFCPIDIVQILNADRAIWARMTEFTASGISLRADGVYPIAQALGLARAHPMVACMLQPLPKNGTHQQQQKPKSGGQQREGPYNNQKAKQGKGQSPNKGSKGKGKGGGKAKGKDRLPYALIGCKSRTNDGQKLCFDFNLPNGCTKEVTQGRCSFGAHACAGCLSTNHGYQACKA